MLVSLPLSVDLCREVPLLSRAPALVQHGAPEPAAHSLVEQSHACPRRRSGNGDPREAGRGPKEPASDWRSNSLAAIVAAFAITVCLVCGTPASSRWRAISV